MLEELNKTYDTRILVSEKTFGHASVQETVLCRLIDYTVVEEDDGEMSVLSAISSRVPFCFVVRVVTYFWGFGCWTGSRSFGLEWMPARCVRDDDYLFVTVARRMDRTWLWL